MHEAPDPSVLAGELADAFLSAPWHPVALAESGAARLQEWPSWMELLAASVVAVHRVSPVDRRDDLVALIESFFATHSIAHGESHPARLISAPGRDPLPAPSRPWATTRIDSVAALAERLELSDGQLAWLADVRSMERRAAAEKLRNYRYRVAPRQGGIPRVLEAPKARLKEIQRWIVREILDHVPPHDAAHGFTRGRSVVTHAQLHTGRAAVLHLDLKDFFASVTAGRVYGIFRAAGYDGSVAHVLTGLSTNALPIAVWQAVPATRDPRLIQARFWLGRQLATPHLPQGAPTSPALANLAAFRLDRRLAGLAAATGLRYSRYADDLTFSGALPPRRRAYVEELVAEIAGEVGFALNGRKSALRAAGGRQLVCGVLVNVRPNVLRSEYDELKAILHNAERRGPRSQNRGGVPDFEAHLRGRISWVAALNPARGDKLRERLAKVRWDDRGPGEPVR